MQHAIEQFDFVDRNGKEVIIKAHQFNFEIEDHLRERFGDHVFDDKDFSGELSTITLKNIEEDFPILLDGDLTNIDWKKQSFDELLRVYHFFVTYKRNAAWRQLESSKETLLSSIEMMEKILNSIPKNLLAVMNSGNIQDSLRQTITHARSITSTDITADANSQDSTREN